MEPSSRWLISVRTDAPAAFPSRTCCDNLFICRARGISNEPYSRSHRISRGAGNHNQYRQPGRLPTREPYQRCIFLKSDASPLETTLSLLLVPGVCSHFILGNVRRMESSLVVEVGIHLVLAVLCATAVLSANIAFLQSPDSVVGLDQGCPGWHTSISSFSSDLPGIFLEELQSVQEGLYSSFPHHHSELSFRPTS